MSDDYLGGAYRTFAYAAEVSYCHDVFCLRPAHPADEEHSDAFGRKYLDGEPPDLAGYRVVPREDTT